MSTSNNLSHPINTIAVIPARGGSKGVPRKNVRPLAGKPLIGHIIEEALKASEVDMVVVSTDDPEIASISKSFGAEVVLRPAELSTDTAASEPAVVHVLEEFSRSHNYLPELTVFLQCTSPLTLAQDIDGTIKALRGENADSALTATPFYAFLWQREQEGGASGINHDKAKRLRRQERAGQYLETGSVYVFRSQPFLETKHRFFGKTVIHEIPRERVWEIDDQIDFTVAEALLKERELLKTGEAPHAKNR